MQDLEGDMLRAVAALRRAVDFLHEYDKLQAALRIDDGGGHPSALTVYTEDGLAAAHRVLDGLRDPAGREPAGRSPNGRVPTRIEPRIPAQRIPHDRHGDPGE
ncbi:hypothetical protein DFJ67_8512 [Asanoa ferruginea]|uniref:Uncharacterized protein n=1 Tax=Asanoa ferruginea TaxID=53367 RepID=A0A3D9ZZ31_9ACTN|nr:hypothetical protein [Asanoa ferruginea]REG02417.1 hypothetical protein DFJ67_8512 [Asanoa ferruginea]GIF46652.1 hypothetical protein Afe04nite_11910 [Asanoa ferruginea]